MRPSAFVRRFALLVALLLMVPLLMVPPAAADHHAEADLDADLAQMMEWFTGEFDNFWQARTEKAEEVEEPHGRIHSIFAPVSWPELGEHVFYVQQYADGDPDKIYRQRLYSFRPNAEEKAIELVIYAPPDPAAVKDAHLDSSKLEGIEVSDLKSYPGCEVYWQRRDDHFVGFTKEGACRVVSSRSGRTLVISDDLKLTADEIWIQDRAVDAEGNYVYGHKGGVPHKLNKVRWFECWAAAPKGEAPKEGEGKQEWDLWRPIRLHDQGGSKVLEPEDERPARYTVELFQATYSGENTVPVLELAVREEGQEKSIAYAWTEPASQRIGINLRTVQIGCKQQ
ncbi:MAG: chromophore lyase CpcT/CpeT [Acidobacteriota bacterium]